MTNKISIISMNVQGLGDKDKRKDVLNYLKNKNHCIYFLQDTHFTDKESNYIRAQWGFECFFSNFSSQARGVAILLNNTFEFKIDRMETDRNGNKLILDMSVEGKNITLINIYGPNRDNPDFYKQLKTDVNSRENLCIIGGDWNLVLNPDIDYCDYRNLNNPRSRDIVIEMMSDSNLIDCWRDQNLEKKQYTWFKKHSNQKARLDFFLISELLLTELDDTKIIPGYRTDHSMICTKFHFGKFEKGNSYWKMNNSLLKDEKYVNEIKQIIENVKLQYAKPEQFNGEITINSLANKNLTLKIDDQLFFEVLLMEIRGKTISYSSYLKKKNNQRENELISDIDNLEQETTHRHDILENKKKELIEIREKKMEGVRVRSRAKWVEEGEKPTSYFCNLENRNFVSKCMTSLISHKNKLIKTQSDILNEAKLFFKKLYSSQNTTQVDLHNVLKDFEVPKLEDNVKLTLEGPITYDDMLNSLKNMANNKSPGPDGFTVEFYKFFWKDIGEFLVRAINDSFTKGELSVTQKQGVITCIPKGDKDKLLLKNWRPISLLNTSYKIASASIAQRLKNILPSIINADQTGFLRGRYIGENIRLIYDLMFHLEKVNKPGMLLLIDFEKAFDSLDWNFIFKVLKYFNFGPSIIKWIKVFYTNIESCLIVNGHLSDWFSLSRGCRQGDPLSPYVFILCAEILAIMIRNDPKIKGITVGSKESKLSQYADDTSIILDGTAESLRNTLRVLKFYAEISGLKINIDKTKVVWIGSKRKSTEKICPEYNLNWDEKFTLLGIHFSVDLNTILNLNYDVKIEAIKRILNNWSKRMLTPIGKITVIKSLAVSKITHLFLSLPNPEEKKVKEIQQLFYKFVWNDKPDKIKRKQLYQNHSSGGLRMIDLNSFIKSLKLTWIRRLQKDDKGYLNIFNESYPNIKQLHLYGSDYISQQLKYIDNPFWKDVFESYKYYLANLIPKSKPEFQMLPIWLNPNIKVGGSSIVKKRWVDKGIFLVKDLFTENGNFLTIQTFKEKYDILTNFIEYEGILKAIRKYLDRLSLHGTFYHTNSGTQLSLSIIQSYAKGCRAMYDRIVLIDKHPPVIRKWIDTLNVTTNIKWNKILKIPFKVTKDPQLQWFQFKIIHRILGTNYLCKKMKIVNSEMCTFCNEQTETIQHLFYECNVISHFWGNFKSFVNERCMGIDTNWSKTDIIFGNIEFDNTLNKILLLAKKFIFYHKFRGSNPSLSSFKRYLMCCYKTEKYIAHKNVQSEKFHDAWNKYQLLVLDF